MTSGSIRCKSNVIDLPGTYFLSAYSLEEMVARDYLALEKPDMVVNIVDASNLERNLYLSCNLWRWDFLYA
ncbi:hypothetical protein MTBBW1_1860047 [Desulfamplus magnetovallimortis]|uniref:FeoB-type G domain-containing protein n=1 Tax=Desulfamplus magnetovallimortis TaxID=1246637 RepID=A0A1W1HAQ1_9BACT|nr:FeoB small GTPase domain-containing protein [Desulfamplus magnetovallimortis]SLM29557.1 hypothetical protein MTBBW1_1860047 [Desulfamplus magnetovallimortis]